MPDVIKPNRMVVDDRQSVAGFTVMTAEPYFEVAVATRPELLARSGKEQRAHSNFFSTRSLGPLPTDRGEAVYLLPPEVLRRFAGQDRLYYAVATFRDRSRATPQVRLLPPEVMPYITISRSFTGQARRSRVGVSTRSAMGGAYGGNAGGAGLEWSGDLVQQPGAEPVGALAPAAPPASGNGHNGNGTTPPANGNGAVPAAGSAGFDYDDGFDPSLWSSPPAAQAAVEAPVAGILGEEIPLDPGVGGMSIGQDALAPGDVILSTVRGDTVSDAIRWASGDAPVSHAMIYTGNGRVVEAIGSGVVERSLPDAIGPATTAVAFRHQNLNDDQARAVVEFALQQVGREYNYWGIVRQALFRLDRWAWCRNLSGDALRRCEQRMARINLGTGDNQSFFCSQLVLAAFGHAGAPLTDGDPSWGSPNDLAELRLSGALGYVGHLKAEVVTAQGLAAVDAYGNGGARPAAPRPVYAPAIARPAQGGGIARAMEVVRPDYIPSDPVEALRTLLQWMREYQAWHAGVPDTSFFPHSAICHFEIDFPSGSYLGSGCFVAPDLILTAAHNVIERDGSGNLVYAHRIKVIPGRNGQNNKPFGEFTVPRNAMEAFPLYTGSGDFDHDIAVLFTGSHGPANGWYFDILEELLVSQPSPIIVCGYAAQPASIDRYRQHLDGDHIRQLSSNMEQMSYNLQTHKGTSGSPVYYVTAREDHERRMSVLETRIVGVHVASQDATLNRCCRLTQAKIDWIWQARARLAGTSTSSAYAAPAEAPQRYTVRRPQTPRTGPSVRQMAVPAPAGARAFAQSVDLNWDDLQLQGQLTNMSCWAAAAAMLVGWRDRMSISEEEIARGSGYWERYSHVLGLSTDDTDEFAGQWGLEAEPSQSHTVQGFLDLLRHNGPLFVVGRVPGLHAFVVTGAMSGGNPDGSDTIVRIADPWGRTQGSPEAPGAYNPTPGQGSRYLLSWADFVGRYEGGITQDGQGTVNVQILHAGGTGGRTPATGTRHAYSFGLAVPGNGAPARVAAAPVAAAAVVEIASAIAGATMTRILDNEGDVNWELDQLQGIKFPQDDPDQGGDRNAYHNKTINVGNLWVENGFTDRITANFEVRFDYNGRSLGNVEITNTGTNDAVGWGLTVKANIMNDARTYLARDGSGRTMAGIKLRFHYRFTRSIGSDKIGIIDIVLYGDGTFTRTSRWTQE